MDRTLASGAESVGSTPAERTIFVFSRDSSKSVTVHKIRYFVKKWVDQKLTTFNGREQSYIHLCTQIKYAGVFDCISIDFFIGGKG